MMEVCPVHDNIEGRLQSIDDVVRSMASTVSDVSVTIGVLNEKVTSIEQIVKANGKKKNNGVIWIVLSVIIAGFVAIPTGIKMLDALLKAFG